MRIVEQKEWNTHQLVKWVTCTKTNHLLSFLVILPSRVKKKVPWIIALHGYTSHKEEWLELDGYTKGGNLVKALADQGYAVVAVDIDYDEMMDIGRGGFFKCTVENIETLISAIVKSNQFDDGRLGFLSYSLGGLFGFWLANRIAPFKTMVMCVPPVGREDNDQYAPYNNLANLTHQSLLYIAAEQDEEIPFQDSQWLFAQLPMTDKHFLSYPSNHSLPLDYVPEALEWFKQRL
jgi:esterase/lipase